jgi:neutral ceramidase
MKAGVYKDIITPPIGTSLAGYAFEKLPSYGIHDQLWVRAVVLEEESTRVALAMCDVIGFDGFLIGKVKSYMRDRIDISEDNIVVGATHTHAGPVGLFGFQEHEGVLARVIGPYAGFEPDDCLIDITARKIAGAIAHAAQDLHEVKAGTLVGAIEGIGKNRRASGAINDPDVMVTLLQGLSHPLCILYSYACHPTVLHQDNRYLSADFPGFSNAQLENVTSALPVYMTGAAGDISTRYTRREKSFNEVRRFGTILAGETLKTASSILAEETGNLDIVSTRVSLPVKKLPPKDQVLENFKDGKKRLENLRRQNASPAELKTAETHVEGAKIALDLLEEGRINRLDRIEIELKLLKMGNIAFLFVPGEMFVQIGKAMKANARSKGYFLHVCCYANGYIGYIPTREAFQDRDYESWAAIVGENTESKLIDTLDQMLINQH